MNLRNSIADFQHQSDILLFDDWDKITDDITLARRIIERLNAYFHETYEGVVLPRWVARNFNIFLIFTNIGKPIMQKLSMPG